MSLNIHLKLMSDATFGRGDGVAGLVDTEVVHDEYGLPYLHGRTLKGLLVEECANILYGLQQSDAAAPLQRFNNAAQLLFGAAGSTLDADARMQVGAAMLPPDLREAVILDVKANRLSPDEVLESLTAIRRQTAVSEETDAPMKNSLRALRVILCGTPFIARLDFDSSVNTDMKALLAACVASLRRAGTGRNRGRGRITAQLCDDKSADLTALHLQDFATAIKETAQQEVQG
jgi:hypothetical protein